MIVKFISVFFRRVRVIVNNIVELSYSFSYKRCICNMVIEICVYGFDCRNRLVNVILKGERRRGTLLIVWM